MLDRLPASAAELADRFAGPLTFGTAGPARPAAGRAERHEPRRRRARPRPAWSPGSRARDGAGPLVIGYDARHGSREFAERDRPGRHRRRARRRCCCPGRCPPRCSRTPSGALGAAAGVMVTASHNPPQDNGYKVYLGAARRRLGAGAQIVPPADAEIEAAIRAVGPLRAGAARRARARCSASRSSSPTWTRRPRVVDPDGAAGPRGRVHPAARGRRRGAHRGASPGRLPGPGGGRRAGRAGPGFPTVAVPEPGGAGRDGPGDRAGRRRPAPTSPSPTTRTPTGARWRSADGRRAAGGCCAATRSACCSPTT